VGWSDACRAIWRFANTISFNGSGEQHQGVHVNQTFTGIAIGVDVR